MKLSIIVPVYNMAADDKLSFCMNSLINQTIEDYEIIAVDDCSTDDSYKILKDYEKRFPLKVKVLQTPENLHQGGAKNLAMDAAKGDWIGFIDADDWITPDYYARLIGKAEETGADMVGCDYCLVNEHTYTKTQPERNNSAEQTGELTEDKYRLLMLDCGSLVVKVYRREIVIDHPGRFPEKIFYEDNALGRSWMLRAKHFEYIEEPLYYYYQHDTSTVHTITLDRLSDRMEAGRIMIKEAKENGYFERFYPEIEYSFAVLFYMNTLMSYMMEIRPRKASWVKALGDEMREYFPNFRENKYFCERVHPEEQKWARMQQKNSLLFVLYYSLKAFYRKLRAKIN